MNSWQFLEVAEELELAGLLWRPEIGDEVAVRQKKDQISVLVDPDGLTPSELRLAYLWLPTVEQMVMQLEARQGILFHAGLELNKTQLVYKTVVQCPVGNIESAAPDFRSSVGLALRGLLLGKSGETIIN